MSSVLIGRRRAEEFDTLVADALASQPRTDRPDTTRFESLVPVVAALRAVEPITPRPDAAAQLRARLVAEAHTVLRPEDATLRLPTRRRGTRERRLLAAATAAVVLGGTAGVAAAAQASLPGQALYPIKRGIEAVEARLSTSEQGRGQDLLDQATNRLGEAHELLAADPHDPAVPATLSDFSDQAGSGADLMFSAYQTDADPATVVAVRNFAHTASRDLGSLADQVPAGNQGELAAAAQLLHDIDQQAAVLCSGCSDQPVVEVPDLLLARAEARRAMSQVASVQRDRLDNSHPVVVPADISGALTGAEASDHPSKPRHRHATAPASPASPPSPDRGGDTGGTGVPAVPSDAPTAIGGLPDLLDQGPSGKQGGADTSSGSGGSGGGPDTSGPTDQLDKTVDDVGGLASTLLPDPTPTGLP